MWKLLNRERQNHIMTVMCSRMMQRCGCLVNIEYCVPPFIKDTIDPINRYNKIFKINNVIIIFFISFILYLYLFSKNYTK